MSTENITNITNVISLKWVFVNFISDTHEQAMQKITHLRKNYILIFKGKKDVENFHPWFSA
jgi:hypothetical protein